MFGLNQQAKVPNSSQYDFKGASVTLFSFRLNHLQAHTNPLLLEVTSELLPMEEQEGLSLIKGEDLVISFKTRLISLRELNIELLSQQRIQTTLKKILKN